MARVKRTKTVPYADRVYVQYAQGDSGPIEDFSSDPSTLGLETDILAEYVFKRFVKVRTTVTVEEA